MDGALLIDKPEGMSSFDVLRILKNTFPKTKMGHLGTLDPMATGLLVVFFGKATQLIRYFEETDKEYAAELEFGKTSDTYDRTGQVEISSPGPWPTREEVEEKIHVFLGAQWQIQPAFSALKYQGKRAYELAREGKKVDLGKRQVTIHELQITDYQAPCLSFRMSCSSGTYVRSFIHELGQAVGCGAVMTALRRTKVGCWRVEAATLPDRILARDIVSFHVLVEECIDFSKHSIQEKSWLLRKNP